MGPLGKDGGDSYVLLVAKDFRALTMLASLLSAHHLILSRSPFRIQRGHGLCR
jgi:hypothetical protein